MVQSLALLVHGETASGLDLWVAGGVAVLIGSGYLLSVIHAATPLQITAAKVLVAAGIVELVALELPAIGRDGPGPTRALVIVGLLCAAHVVGLVRNRTPITMGPGWASITLAAIVGIDALASGAIETVELVSVPIGLALIATGAVTLRRFRSAGSWPWLAPGLFVLLVPSLVSTLWDASVVRLVSLGMACVGLLVGSVVLKLQSPFILSAISLLALAVSTFAPGIAAVYHGGAVVGLVGDRRHHYRCGECALREESTGRATGRRVDQ